ncbi:hypothetical protein AURDEDRAFT_184545 [Auricularia subglabra TFB-10046 SS5]|nr:hypothetical protein AURDEDRAFT_184545 [Auricularia subglabra TFB-10046 SS5]
MTIAWLLLGLSLAYTAAAKRQVVLVGAADEGESSALFTPAHVHLDAGDELVFSFNISGTNHSVVQSSRDAPCAPIKGGFNSGFIEGGSSSANATFSLLIETVDTPIFFYCAQVDAETAVPHCARGMWGNINADSDAIETYSEAIAKITALPNQTPWNTASPASPPSTSTSTTSHRPAPSDNHSPSRERDPDDSEDALLSTGAIIGIALSSVSCVAAAAAIWIRRRRQRASAEPSAPSPPVYLSVEMQSDPGSRLTAVYGQVGGLTVLRAPSVHSQAPTYHTDPFVSPEDFNPFTSPDDLETATLHSAEDQDVPPEYASSHSAPPSFQSHTHGRP